MSPITRHLTQRPRSAATEHSHWGGTPVDQVVQQVRGLPPAGQRMLLAAHRVASAIRGRSCTRADLPTRGARRCTQTDSAEMPRAVAQQTLQKLVRSIGGWATAATVTAAFTCACGISNTGAAATAAEHNTAILGARLSGACRPPIAFEGVCQIAVDPATA